MSPIHQLLRPRQQIRLTDRKLAKEQLRTLGRQQAALADLGQQALAATDLAALMDSAVSLVAETLAVEYCKVLELVPDGSGLRLRAGVGWRDGFVGAATVSAGTESQAGYTLLSDEPVVVEDLRTETRFSGPPLLHDHGVVSGLSVIIRGQERPFGVLGAHTATHRIFSADDIHFVQSVANMLGQVIQRKQAEAALRESEARLGSIIDSAMDAIITVDTDQRVVLFNPAAEQIFRCPAAQAIGQPLDRFIPERFRAAHREHIRAFDQTMATKEMRGALGRVSGLRADGEEFPIEASISRVEIAGRQLRTVILRDITERRRTEAAVRDSEQHFRSLIEKALDLVAIVDANGTYRYVSPSHVQTSGFTPDELLGRNGFDFVHPDDRPEVSRRLAEAIQDGATTVTAAYRFRHKDGSWRAVEAVIRNLLDDPVVAGMLVNARDITERKRAEEASRESEKRYRRLAENAYDLIAEVSFDGSLLYVSPNHKDVLGYDPSELVGKIAFELVHPDDLARVTTLVATKSAQTMFRFRHKTGQWRWFEGTGKAFRTATGERRGVIISRDVTERLRAEEEIRRLNVELEQRVLERTAQLEAANNELEAFSYSVSHDLQAPLRHISGFCKLLLGGSADRLDEQAKHYLDRVCGATERMGQLINDLLGLSRLTLGTIRWQPVNLSTLAQTIAEELQKTLLHRQVEFVIATNLVTRGDAGLLRVALENLLGNAWKYTSKNPHARIEFGVTQVNGQTAYFVRDDDAGFDMAYAGKLFGAFQRLHRSDEFEGSGIGLATVQRIIHRHRGRIWAEGAVEQGATFYFTLAPSSSNE
ncbi:MAG: PAS domain S-box protein [Candidatus Binatia bacterium]